MKNNTNLVIERLTSYSQKDAIEIGQLMPSLRSKIRDDSPIDKKALLDIINSPWHDMIVARLDDKIVGTASLSIIMGPANKRIAYLVDFVTDPNLREQGIGSKIWDAILKWCEEKGAKRLDFTSKPSREAAHKFYLSRGAVIQETDVFRKEIGKSRD
ncbi:MAG: GNAT family N-acetyltransferase [Candidatus Nanosyncoccaceae bacterium]